MCAPYIGPVSILKYLPAGQIEQVLCDGENYGGALPCHYEWVKSLGDECEAFFCLAVNRVEVEILRKIMTHLDEQVDVSYLEDEKKQLQGENATGPGSEEEASSDDRPFGFRKELRKSCSLWRAAFYVTQ